MTMRLFGGWDNVNVGFNEVHQRDVMAIQATMRRLHTHTSSDSWRAEYEEFSNDWYRLTQEFWRDDWEEMDRYQAAEKLELELKTLVREGRIAPYEHIHRYIDGTTEVVKPTNHMEKIMYKPSYLERIGDALRIVMASISYGRDQHLESDLVSMIKLHSGEQATKLEEADVKAARERLDLFTGALVRALDAGTMDASTIDDHLVSICNMAAKYHSVSTNINTETGEPFEEVQFKYYHSYNGVYSIRAGEIITKMLLQVAEQTDSGYLLAMFSVTSHYGMLKRASRSGRNGRVHRLINELKLLSYYDESEVEGLLREFEYETCNDCGDWDHADNMRRSYGDHYDICPVCIENHYTWSSFYDDYIHNDSATEAMDEDGDTITIDSDDDRFYYDDDTGMYVHQDYRPSSKILRRYHTAKGNNSYRLIPSPFTQVTGRYMGLELEVEVSDRSSRNVNTVVEELNTHLNDDDVGSNVWFEEDGSLSHGFEIISNPMGLDTHTEFWQWLNDDSLVKGLRSHDTSTCGLHIHINKSALTTMQIDKMNVFINHPDNAELIKKVSRRYSTGYARIGEKQLGKAHSSYERYEAFNITNTKTVELRIFKGTLKYTSLMAAIEFANALVNFTAPASPAGFRLDSKTFMKFIDMPAYRNETKFLRNYLEQRTVEAV